MFAMMAATYVPFLQSIGLSLSQVTAINVLFWLTIVIFEVPTGMLADARSRSWSLRIGFFLYAVGFTGYFFAKSFWAVAAFELLDGIAFTFLSGVQQAWITDALVKHGRGSEKGKVFAEATIIRGLVSLPGALLGAWIGSVLGLAAVWIFSITFALLGVLVVYLFMGADGEATNKVNEVEALKLSIKVTRTNPALRWSIIMNLIFALVMAFNHLWSPYFLQWVSLPTLGLLWAPLYLSITIAGWMIRRAKIASGSEAKGIMLSLVVAGFGLLMIGQTQSIGLAIAMGIIYEIGRGGFGPLLDSYTQHHVNSNHRATYGSLQSLTGEIGSALVLLSMSLYMSGKPDTPATISTVWLGAGGLLIVLAFAFYLLRPKEQQN